ncbi:hypothetical protein KTE28_18355 [Burkholderia multivorans]|uniref:phage tail fiber domain-containing protein n=1 Tax=Burkholderia multivorans TaxID=87883 RepID=UPI001C27A9E3|nr:phage tail fiber protein [Burkholderia multivorans]MBU9376291.1 hypothetical protein [Burkholderia multivorans]
MAADYLVPWLKASGQDGLRRSMLVVQGDGVTRTFSFNFAGGYISKDHIKAYTFTTATGTTAPVAITSDMWTGTNSLTFPAPIPVGQFLVIYRDTPKDKPLVDFKNGAILNEPNLDEMADQAVFAAAEMVDRFDTVNDGSAKAIQDSATAVNTANAAVNIANGAVATAQHADGNATYAVNQANNANSNASYAVATADAAKATADGIDAKAQSALDNSTAAVSTANAAKATADGIDAKATQAQSDAAKAVSTANAAATTANGIDAKATKAQSDAAAAVSAANAANAAMSGKVSKSGDVISWLTIDSGTAYSSVVLKANGYAPRIQTAQDSSMVGFVNGANNAYNLMVYDGGQVSTRGNLTVGGSTYAGGNNATIAPDGNVWGPLWGGWLRDYVNSSFAFKGGDTFSGRMYFSKPGWQADVALHNWRSGQDAWVYLRARDGGGLEVINSAYNGVPWSVADWGETWQNGNLHVGGATLQTDGNLWLGFRGRWLSDETGKLDDAWNKANDAQVNRADRYAQCQIAALEEVGPIYINSSGQTWIRRDNPWVMNGIAYNPNNNNMWVRFAWLRNN